MNERGNVVRESFLFSASRSTAFETRKSNSDSRLRFWEKLVAFDRRDSQSIEFLARMGKKERKERSSLPSSPRRRIARDPFNLNSVRRLPLAVCKSRRSSRIRRNIIYIAFHLLWSRSPFIPIVGDADTSFVIWQRALHYQSLRVLARKRKYFYHIPIFFSSTCVRM